MMFCIKFQDVCESPEDYRLIKDATDLVQEPFLEQMQKLKCHNDVSFFFNWQKAQTQICGSDGITM